VRIYICNILTTAISYTLSLHDALPICTAMRAVAHNQTAASLVGINNDRIISFTFALGSAMAAAGGILYASNYPSIDPLMGTLPRSEEHTSELQSRENLVCRLLLEKKNI